MAYYGLLGPAGMPKEIVDKYYAAVQKVVAEPAVQNRIEETGSIINVNGPDAFAKEIKAEYAVYKEVVAKQKLQLD
jgi:tripartite-type tricarboxylate transporter receptor subunit TctC